MIFYSITPDGSRKYAARKPSDFENLVRKAIPPALLSTVTMLDQAMEGLPRSVTVQAREDFIKRYTEGFGYFRDKRKSPEEIGAQIAGVRDAGLNIVKMIRNPQAREQFFRVVLSHTI